MGITPFIDFYVPDYQTMVWLAVAGALYFFGGLPYLKAMQMEEPTRINIWWNLIPLFSLAVGWMFFDEKFTGFQLFAFVFLVGGAVIGSIHARGRKIVFSRAVLLMAASTFAFALYGLIFRKITFGISFALGFVWISIIMFIYSFCFFVSKKFRGEFKMIIRSFTPSLAGAVLAVASADHVGVFFNQWALSYAASALVFSLEGSQVIFVFIIATSLSVFAPNIIKEEVDRKNILLKLIALIFIVIGVIALALT